MLPGEAARARIIQADIARSLDPAGLQAAQMAVGERDVAPRRRPMPMSKTVPEGAATLV